MGLEEEGEKLLVNEDRKDDVSPPGIGRLCVFCGSAMGDDRIYREEAARLGRILAETGVRLVYGGGDVGLMGVLANACMAAGGSVTGIIPEHLKQVEAPASSITELIVVDSMHTRKRKMFDLADAFCVLPGGLGTLDETFEILTWKQLRRHNKPIVLANIGGYWDPWLVMLERIVGSGFARPSARGLFSVAASVDEVLPQATAALATDSSLF